MEGSIPVEIREKVKEVRMNTVSPTSKAVYKNSYCRFLAWLVRTRATDFSEAFLEKLGALDHLTEKQVRQKLKLVIETHPDVHPIKLENLAAETFVSWLLTLETK